MLACIKFNKKKSTVTFKHENMQYFYENQVVLWWLVAVWWAWHDGSENTGKWNDVCFFFSSMSIILKHFTCFVPF